MLNTKSIPNNISVPESNTQHQSDSLKDAQMFINSSSDILYTNNKPFLPVFGDRTLVFEKGEGMFLYDDTGKEYLDFVGGIAVNALGHHHPQVIEALKNQLDKLIHVSNLYISPSQRDLAELLTQITPYPKVFFCNSGTEASEGAIKFVRKYWYHHQQPQRIHILSFHQSFHGRSYGALSATGQEYLQKGFGPMLPGFSSIPLNDIGLLEQTCIELDQTQNPLAAVMLEPILAEGGVLSPSQEFLNKLFDLQAQYGFLIVADEIQTGIGRTGRLLASETWPRAPHIVTLAKPLGGGLPLGAVLVCEEVASTIHKGDHGSTFGGNPVACAGGLATLQTLLQPGFLEEANQNIQYFRQRLTALAHQYSMYLSPLLLGEGFIIGVQVQLDLAKFIANCQTRGLLVHRAGTHVLRLLPPLIIQKSHADKAIEILQQVIQTLISEGENHVTKT